MMPTDFDPDSNWAMEVMCDAPPTFRRPNAWPQQCDNCWLFLGVGQAIISHLKEGFQGYLLI